MTIESDLKRLADSAERIVELLLASNPAPAGTVDVTAAPAQPAPVPTPAPQPEQNVVQMPPPPAQPAPAPAPAPQAAAPVNNQVPFTDSLGLQQYTMAVFKELGNDKGSQIGGILTNLGYGSITDVKPEHFGTFYEQVEALKHG